MSDFSPNLKSPSTDNDGGYSNGSQLNKSPVLPFRACELMRRFRKILLFFSIDMEAVTCYWIVFY